MSKTEKKSSPITLAITLNFAENARIGVFPVLVERKNMHVGLLCGCVVEVVCGKDVCVCGGGGGEGGGGG